MIFIFESEKSLINLEKHGIDFKNVQALWDDEERIEIPAKIINETCWLVIGKINGKH